MALRDLAQKPVRTAFIIFALALVVRIAWTFADAHELRSDELDYHKLAVSLTQHWSYAIDGVPTAYRPPGYPLALWLIYSFTGNEATAARLAQAVFDALLAGLVFLSLSRNPPDAALVAGLSWALFPAAILYSGLLLGETVFTVIIFGAVLIFERTKGNGPAALSGLVLGFACLIKPWALAFAALALTFGLLRKNPDRRLVVVVTVAVLTLLPWMLRNELRMGFFGISTNIGMNLYVGNNPDAKGGYRGTFPQEIASAADDELRLDSVSTSLATEYIMREPLRFALNGVLKVARLVASEGELLVLALSTDAGALSYRQRHADISLIAKVLVNAPSFAFLLLGITGLVASAQSVQRASALLLIASIVLTTLVFFGSSRFRFPAMPFLVMYGSIAAVSFRSTVQGLSSPKKIIAGTLVAMVAAVWIAEFFMLANA